MKTLKIVLAFTICAFCFGTKAQNNNSYDQMQNRFEKKKLEPADSAAFIQSGIQKAKTLFEYNDVYLRNSANRSNQMYVEQKVPELFYMAEGDSVNIDLVMQEAQAVVQKQMGKSVELKYTEKEGVLGQVTTVDTNPTFQADLVLIQKKKAFGKTSKKVWQVFLANPEFSEK